MEIANLQIGGNIGIILVILQVDMTIELKFLILMNSNLISK
jgi:hypothetical protein